MPMPPGYGHLERCTSGPARRALAERLGLRYQQDMQDWEYEVAEAELLPALFDLAGDVALTDDQRLSLGQIIIQAIDMIEEHQPGNTPEWLRARDFLRARPLLHASTIWYWSCLGDAADPDAKGFAVSTAMVRLWREILPLLPYKAEAV